MPAIYSNQTEKKAFIVASEIETPLADGFLY